MELYEVLEILKKKKDWLALFEDGEKLKSQVKKKGPKLTKNQRAYFRSFLEQNGNIKLIEAKDEPYSKRKEVMLEIAKNMAEKDNISQAKSYAICFQFDSSLHNVYEKLDLQKEEDKVSNRIFEESINVPKRLAILEKSNNAIDLFEAGEIYLKSEDFFDIEKASANYEAAAKKGISDGLLTIGLYHQLDAKDFAKAKEVYESLLNDYHNDKGYTGLALLYKDNREENPYHDEAKALEMAETGADAMEGTSMFILGALKTGEDEKEAFKLLDEASIFDINLSKQRNSAYVFVNQIYQNLQINYKDFFASSANQVQDKIRKMIYFLYASKYNMTENLGRYLETTMALMKQIETFYEGKYTLNDILKGFGLNKELIESLVSQYLIRDDKTQKAIDEFSSVTNDE